MAVLVSLLRSSSPCTGQPFFLGHLSCPGSEAGAQGSGAGGVSSRRVPAAPGGAVGKGPDRHLTGDSGDLSVVEEGQPHQMLRRLCPLSAFLGTHDQVC